MPVRKFPVLDYVAGVTEQRTSIAVVRVCIVAIAAVVVITFCIAAVVSVVAVDVAITFGAGMCCCCCLCVSLQKDRIGTMTSERNNREGYSCRCCCWSARRVGDYHHGVLATHAEKKTQPTKNCTMQTANKFQSM